MKDVTIFDDVKLSDLLKSIHSNTINKREDINSVVQQLVPMIKSADDAILLAPIIREFYDVGVRNDEHMLKIATIVQRIISADSYSSTGGGDLDTILSDEEKEALIKNASQELLQLKGDVEDTNKEIKTLIEKAPTNG